MTMDAAYLIGRIKAMTGSGFRCQLTEDREIRIGISEAAQGHARRILQPGQLVFVQGTIGTDRILASTVQILYSADPKDNTAFAGYCIAGGALAKPQAIKNITF